MQVYKGESIAETFTSWGCGCSFKSKTIAPQLVKYKFDLHNILDLQKAKKLAVNLSALIDETVTFSDKVKGASFEISISRNERELIETKHFGGVIRASAPFSIMFGVDTDGENVLQSLEKLPHLLIAGTTGSGKSVALNSYIMELCCYNSVDDLGMLLIDLKQTELSIFERLPHLIHNIVCEKEEAENVLAWMVKEMEQRYKTMKEAGIFNYSDKFKTICIVIDELSDLVLQSPKSKDYLVRILQKARACGIFVICATQSPRAKVLDGLMLANLPSRIALTCANMRESMLVLGHKGAEQLQGNGDAIIKLNGTTEEKRIQIPFISKLDILKLLRKR